MKTVLVTGANSGIGKEISIQLDQLGFQVLLIARNQDRLDKVSSLLKNSPITMSCDLNNMNDLEKIDSFLEPYKNNFCGLINNAGIFIQNDFMSTTDKNWQDLFNINLLAPAIITRKCIKVLKNNQSTHKFIMNISSTASARPIPGTSAYGALKGALDHLTKVLALEVAGSKICVNSISPGIIDTPIHNFKTLEPDQMKEVHKMQPLNRVGQPKDISSMVAFLADENNNWITGSNFIVDGGISLT